MTDTEAGFALQDDEDIVAFIRRYAHDPEARYEVYCACQVLGSKLLKKHRLMAIWKRINK